MKRSTKCGAEDRCHFGARTAGKLWRKGLLFKRKSKTGAYDDDYSKLERGKRMKQVTEYVRSTEKKRRRRSKT